MNKVEKTFFHLLRVGVAAMLLMSLTLLFLLTLSYDEAWLFSRIIEIFEGKKNVWKMAPQAFTNGGPVILYEFLVYSLIDLQVWAFRFASFFSLILILFLCWRWSRERNHEPIGTYLVFATFLGMWGTLELGGLAFHCVPAMLFLLFGLHCFNQKNKNALVIAGISFGFAAATRLNCAAIFPALLIGAAFPPYRLRNALTTCIIGSLVFALNHLALYYFSPITLNELINDTFYSSGMDRSWIDYPRILNKWVVGNGFFPLFLMVGATGFAFYDRAPYSSALRILAIFGWIHWAAWIFKAPIAHLRYLWPTLAAFAIVMGFGLSSLYDWAKRKEIKGFQYATVGIAIGLITMGVGTSFRSLIHGETNILTWEWSREAPLSRYRYFRHFPDQYKMDRYLEDHVQQNETIGVIGVNMELELLSERKIVPLSYYMDGENWNGKTLPRRILITPMIGHYLYLDPAFTLWMQHNVKKEAQFGQYVLYHVQGKYPDKPQHLKVYHTPHPSFPNSGPFFD